MDTRKFRLSQNVEDRRNLSADEAAKLLFNDGRSGWNERQNADYVFGKDIYTERTDLKEMSYTLSKKQFDERHGK